MVDLHQLLDPFASHLGIETLSMQDGMAELTVELIPELLNAAGMAHGGLMATLVDCAAGTAAFTAMAEDKMPVTTDFNLTCLKACFQGFLTAKSKVVHRGRRLMHCEVEVYREQILVARGAVSFMVIDRPVMKAQ